MNRRAVAVIALLAVVAGGGVSYGAPKWAESFEEAARLSKAQNRPIMVFFTSHG